MVWLWARALELELAGLVGRGEPVNMRQGQPGTRLPAYQLLEGLAGQFGVGRDDLVHTRRRLPWALGPPPGTDDRRQALMLKTPGHTANGVAVHAESRCDVDVFGQPGTRQRDDASRLSLFVCLVIEVDRRWPEEDGSLALRAEQTELLAYRSAGDRSYFEQFALAGVVAPHMRDFTRQNPGSAGFAPLFL